MEEWKQIKDFPKYIISNEGRIKNAKGQILKPYVNHKGYFKIGLMGDDKKMHKKRVHRLVAETFIPNTNNLPEVNHLNFNKQDNRVENLEWCTDDQNREHFLHNRVKRRYMIVPDKEGQYNLSDYWKAR